MTRAGTLLPRTCTRCRCRRQAWRGSTCDAIRATAPTGSPAAGSKPAVHSGGCIDLEDPDRDAREARPQWRTAAAPVVIVADPGLRGDGMATRFSVWQLPGRKFLSVDHRLNVRVTSRLSGTDLTLTLDAGLLLGDAYAFRVAASTAPDEAAGVMHQVRAAMRAGAVTVTTSSRPLVSRSNLVHLRGLQTLDGLAAGASQRTLARVLFGAEAVTRRWTADGELRAQVRYLVRRATVLRDGGYRALLPSSCDPGD